MTKIDYQIPSALSLRKFPKFGSYSQPPILDKLFSVTRSRIQFGLLQAKVWGIACRNEDDENLDHEDLAQSKA